ncbi:MAG TPA: GNAT family N-acetyltransferase [Thermomicrobiales bacterium]|jgi:RimJ/RimL family protein N-acetyltransferase
MTRSVRLRRFEDRDYAAIAAVANAIFPDDPRDAEDIRRRDRLWDGERYDLLRLVGENATGQIVAWGQLNHLPHHFHPGRYRIGIYVEPGSQRRGVGGQIHDCLQRELRGRRAAVVGARARSDMAESVRFLTRRGFAPVEETAESRLNVADFDPRCADEAEARLAAEGIAITTLAAERDRNRHVLPDVHALYLACLRDVPTAGATTDVPFRQFVAREIEAPNVVPEAIFLAVADGCYVGMCAFVRHPGLPDVLSGRMTGSLPSVRGRGIVSALKLRMAAYAHAHGFREIRTWNSAQNTAMVGINERMGFVRHTAWITLQRDESEFPGMS